jgi:uncharacterized protein
MTAPASEVENATDLNTSTSDSPCAAFHGQGRRILVFASMVTAILLIANAIVLATWDYFYPTSAKPLLWITSTVLTLSFVATTILAMGYSNFWLRLAYRISATWLGVLNYAVFAACAVWIFSAATTLFGFHIEPKVIAALFFGGAILVSLYGLVNASCLRVTRVTAKLAHLPEAWRGRTVALVTDMHLGNVRGSGLTRRVVAKLQQLHPEAVLLSGDMFDGSKADFDAMLAPWKKYSGLAGTYFVTGNHEEFTNRAKFLNSIEHAGIRILNNEKIEINGLQLIGVHDGESQDPRVFQELLQGMNLDRHRASILLAHQPSNLAIAAHEGVSLQVSGHTHGGQIWPWTLAASRVHRRFNRGLNRFRNLLVHTSTGVGTWGVPMRVGTKSEIVLIRLEPSL